MGNVFYTVVIYPLTQIIEFAFSFTHKLCKNTGFSLLGVSLAVSFLTLPLYAVAEHWQEVERNTQAKMKAQVSRIKKAFRGDEQYMILSTYYRQNGYHPIMQLRSAFGILIQIPFFTAAYTYLSSMSALQNHHLFFIRNLGAPDALFSIGNFSVNVLPVLMTVINLISGTIYTKGLPAKEKIQVYGLALVFVVLLYNSPSGLVIYWTMNNLFSLIKNVYYRFKNPLKSFYFTVVAVCVPSIFLTIFSGRFGAKQKFFSILFLLLLIAVPLLIKFAKFIADNFLLPLQKNKKERNFLFFISSVSLTVLTGYVIPSLLVASSPVEFSGTDVYPNPAFFVHNTFFQCVGFFFLWPSLIYFLYREKFQSLLAASFFFVLLASFADVFLFQENYGYLSKMLIFTEASDVSSSTKSVVLNLAVLAAIFVAVIFIVRLNFTKYANALISFAAISLAAICVINEGKILSGYKEYLRVSNSTNVSGEVKPIFHLSKKGRNVMLIFLDRAQNNFVEPILDESPALKNSFSGFTLYKNTVSYNPHTLIGAPPVHGGYEYTPLEMNRRSDVSLVEKTNEAILVLPRIFTEQGENFSATSSDASWANFSWIPDISIFRPYPKISAFVTENAYLAKWYDDNRGIGNFTVNSDTLKRNTFWYAIFRASPLLFRSVIYEDGRYWSADEEGVDLNKYLGNYATMHYLRQLTDFECPTENSFLSFTNNATHTSMLLQYPDYVPVQKVTDKGSGKYAGDASYSSMAGVMHRLGEFFDYLKQNDCYDNSRILIVSDHGATSREDCFQWDEKFNALAPGKFHPIFMFKDFGEKGDFKTSSDFMTNADSPAILTAGIIENPTNPFTHKKISSAEKENGALVTKSNIFMPHHSKSKNIFTVKETEWYRVKDDIFKSENWNQEIRGTEND